MTGSKLISSLPSRFSGNPKFMEEGGGDDDNQLCLPDFPPLLGLGLALGLTMVSRSPPKPLSVAIKLTNSALSIPKVLLLVQHFTPQESILFFSKTLVETYKVSKRLNLFQQSSRHRTHFSKAVKTLKPCLGAAGLLESSCHFSAVFDNGFLGFGVLSYGYKVSKNFIKVLKGVGVVELDDAVRNGLESLGLVVKAVKVAKELKHIKDRRRHPDPVCGICGDTDDNTTDGVLRSKLCLVSDGRMLDFGHGGVSDRLLLIPAGSCPFPDCCSSCDVGDVSYDEEILRELLCLSIPVDE